MDCGENTKPLQPWFFSSLIYAHGCDYPRQYEWTADNVHMWLLSTCNCLRYILRPFVPQYVWRRWQWLVNDGLRRNLYSQTKTLSQRFAGRAMSNIRKLSAMLVPVSEFDTQTCRVHNWNLKATSTCSVLNMLFLLSSGWYDCNY